ncbi:hypothetical protein B0H14DRAFT_3127454 [Mycena olivaceomarginata]|nr:hypothetical protein B0H14DRAFT_3127454 [Mycena olivaceomarginata]
MHPPTLNTPHAPSFRAARSPSRAPLTGGIAPHPLEALYPYLQQQHPTWSWHFSGSAQVPGVLRAAQTLMPPVLVVTNSGGTVWTSGEEKMVVCQAAGECEAVVGTEDPWVRAEAGAHVHRERARRLPWVFVWIAPESEASRATVAIIAALPRWTGGGGSFVVPVLLCRRSCDMRRKATPPFLGRRRAGSVSSGNSVTLSDSRRATSSLRSDSGTWIPWTPNLDPDIKDSVASSPILATPTAEATGLSGWYWCALDKETPGPEKSDASGPILATPAVEVTRLGKHCFSNGGSWYWCAIDKEIPDAEDSIASSPAFATPTAEATILNKCCFSNGGGWYYSSSFPMSGLTADADWSALFPRSNGFLQLNDNGPLQGFSMFHGLHCLNSIEVACLVILDP